MLAPRSDRTNYRIRPLTNAIRLPSGDQAASPPSAISSLASRPLADTIQMAVAPACLRVNAMKRPSDDHAGFAP